MKLKQFQNIPWKKGTRFSVYDESGNIELLPAEVKDKKIKDVSISYQSGYVKVEAKELVGKMADRFRQVSSLEELKDAFSKGILYQNYKSEEPSIEELALTGTRRVLDSNYWIKTLSSLTKEDLKYFYVEKQNDLSERAVKRLWYFSSILDSLLKQYQTEEMEKAVAHSLYPFQHPLHEVTEKVHEIVAPYKGTYDYYTCEKKDLSDLLFELSYSLDSLTETDEEKIFNLIGDLFVKYPLYYQRMFSKTVRTSNLGQCAMIIRVWADYTQKEASKL